MANRTFNEKYHTLIKRPVQIFCAVSVGAAGAVTLKKRQFTAMGATSTAASSSLVNAPTTGVGYAVGNAEGVRSVSRTGVGAWTVTLSDSYQYLIGVDIAQTLNTTGVMTAQTVGVLSSSNVTTNTALGNGGVLSLLLQNASGASNIGAAVDPASGDTIVLRILLGDATEP